MKKGISLILIIIMVFIVIILGFMCAISVSNGSSSFLHISECKELKNEAQKEVDSLIYKYENYLGKSITIKEGYLYTSSYDKSLPKIQNSDTEYDISINSINYLAGGELSNVEIYLDKSGIVHVSYLFFKF